MGCEGRSAGCFRRSFAAGSAGKQNPENRFVSWAGQAQPQRARAAKDVALRAVGYLQGQTTAVLEAAFGVPDAKRGDTWVYNKMIIFDCKTRRRLNTVNFLIQDGLVVLVQSN